MYDGRMNVRQHPALLHLEEWMLICQRPSHHKSFTEDLEVQWTAESGLQPNIAEAGPFLSQQRQRPQPHPFETTANPDNLMSKQSQAYTVVKEHFSTGTTATNWPPLLRLTVSGTAGTGKSYLIQCLRAPLQKTSLLLSQLVLQRLT